MRNDAGINGDAQRIEQISWLLFLKVYDSKEEDWEFSEDSYKSIIPEPCRWRNWAHDEDGKGITGDTLLKFVNETLFPTLKQIKVDTSTPIREAIVQSTFAEAHNFMQDGVLLRQVVNVIDSLNLSDYEESHAFGEIYESILKELQSAGSAGEFYTPRGVTDFMARMVEPQIGQTMADFACGTGGFITSWLKELRKKVKTTADEDAWSNSIYGMEKKQFPYMLCVTNMLLHDIDDPKVYHGNSLAKKLLDYTDKDKFDCILMNPPYGGSEKNDVKSYFPDNLASSETADLFMAVIMYRLKENGKAAVVLPDGFLFGNDNAKNIAFFNFAEHLFAADGFIFFQHLFAGDDEFLSFFGKFNNLGFDFGPNRQVMFISGVQFGKGQRHKTVYAKHFHNITAFYALYNGAFDAFFIFVGFFADIPTQRFQRFFVGQNGRPFIRTALYQHGGNRIAHGRQRFAFKFGHGDGPLFFRAGIH